MNWNQVTHGWDQWTAKLQEVWRKLNEKDLVTSAGKRAQRVPVPERCRLKPSKPQSHQPLDTGHCPTHISIKECPR